MNKSPQVGDLVDAFGEIVGTMDRGRYVVRDNRDNECQVVATTELHDDPTTGRWTVA